MNEIMTTSDMLDKLDDFVPDLLKMRDRIDSMILEIKLFNSINGVGSDRTKIKAIFRVITEYFDVPITDLKGRSREGDARRGRQIFCAMAKELTELSYQSIGDYVNRDHATVMHSKRVIDDARDTSHALYDHYEIVKKHVLNALDAI